MKKKISLLILIMIFSYLTAQEFQIEKISEIAYAQGSSGSDCIQVIDNYLYYLSHNGLEIYEINGDGSVTKLSILTITASGRMIIKDQYCFIVSGGYACPSYIPGYHIKINKIDISDVFNPMIVDYVEYPDLNCYLAILKLGNYMVMKWFVDGEGFYDDFYSLPEMEYIGQIISDNYHTIVNDSLLVRQNGYILYIEQYNPPDELEIIGIIDVSAYADGNDAYDHFKVTNDTILSAVTVRNITFWDISDVTSWQYLSRYTLPENVGIAGNKQYAIMGENAVIFDSYLLRLLDISDIINSVLVDSLEHNMYLWGQGCDHFENNLYVGSVNDGIKHFRIENNIVEYIDSYYEHKRFYIGDKYNDKLIVSTMFKGYYLFDVEDPLNPVDLGEWFNEKNYWFIHKQGDWIVLGAIEEFRFEFYNITNLENPVLRNTLSLDYFNFVWTICIIDEFDQNSIYLFNYQTNMFRKFDISEPGEAVELFEYELPSTLEGLTIINSVAYVTVGTFPYDLLVIAGLEDNEPYLANEINNFTDNQYLDGQEGYLITNCVAAYGDIAQVFQLDDPLQPELYFTPQWGVIIEIQDDLIFSKIDYIVGVYENKPNSTEPIAIFNGLNYMYNIELIEHEGTNYLITTEMVNIGLFEYTYIPSSTDDEMFVCKPYLVNYPNPFNPETKIVFNIPEEGNVKLEIYNIKGQKVKTLMDAYTAKGEFTAIWHGRDDNGKRVGSGVYFYQLQTPSKSYVKKCMLLK